MIPSTRHEIENLPYKGPRVGENYTTVPCLGDAYDLMLFNEDESLTKAIANNGFWESWVTAWHVQNISEGDIYIDLGANAGYFSFLAEHLGAVVYAFEANPKYCSLMDKGAVLNGSSIRIINRAIADLEGGSVKLNFYGNLDGSASIVGGGWSGRYVDVKTSKLDFWRFPPGNIIIKMDIEGAEELAWDGMQELLEHRKPTIIMEYTPGAYSDEFWDKLNEYGKISMVNYDAYEEIVTKKFAESQTDWLTLTVRPW